MTRRRVSNHDDGGGETGNEVGGIPPPLAEPAAANPVGRPAGKETQEDRTHQNSRGERPNNTVGIFIPLLLIARIHRVTRK